MINRNTNHTLVAVLVVVALLAFATCFATAEEISDGQPRIKRLPPAQIMVDEDVLAAFVDEPCRHFEAASELFLARKTRQAADRLRTATAYLRLEAARASDQGRVALEASIRELGELADAIHDGRVRSIETLRQSFVRAHYALAGHHCLKSAHRCCQPATFSNKDEAMRAGQDLRAATIHLQHGSLWSGTELDDETRRAIMASQHAAENMIRQGGGLQSHAQRAISNVHSRLESVTGRRVKLAQPLTPENDKIGPSIFR